MHDVYLLQIPIATTALGFLMGKVLTRWIFKPKQWIEAVEVKQGYKWKEPKA